MSFKSISILSFPLVQMTTWKIFSSLLLLLTLAYTEGCCPNSCSGNGICTSYGSGCTCSCFTGFFGGDCSLRMCPSGPAWSDMAIATDRAHQPAMCSNRGRCDTTTGKCTCDPGFTGLACDRMECPNNCNNRGECRSLKFHALLKDRGEGPAVKYDANWDSEMIYGCVCHPGYAGGDCSKRTCPTGDDPLTGANDDTLFGHQLNEKQTVYCAATDGTLTLSFRGQTTVPINVADGADDVYAKLNALTTVGEASVTFGGSETEMCNADGTYVTVEFTQTFGSLPLLVGDSTNLVHAVVDSDPELTVTKTEDGSKENEQCSNRGFCDELSGYCRCYPGYISSAGDGLAGERGDCGAAESSIVACPGVIACTNHGYCSGPPQFRCFCAEGWTSGDCSVRTCPKGRAWFDMPSADDVAHDYAVCSGVGVCNTVTGQCSCPSHFTGGACERLKCPGNTPCSGHGQCLTMEELAREARVNGDPVPVNYGQTPNLAKTWDFNKVQGCLCDEGWEGHDCSLRSCPRGDDPHTQDQVNEVQVITCEHTQTTAFRLWFRGEATDSILSTATASELKAAMEAVRTIGRVQVAYSLGDATSACTTNGAASNAISILFADAMGDLPSLHMEALEDPTYLPVFTIDTDGVGDSVQGTTENAVCSNNGKCDYASGVCKCFKGMSSSDGYNRMGLRQDCGNILSIEAVVDQDV